MMIKWFVHFTGRHRVKACHCFEEDEQQARHFASLVNGEVVLEVNGHVIPLEESERKGAPK